MTNPPNLFRNGPNADRSVLLRALFLTGIYALSLSASFWLSFQLRFDFQIPPHLEIGMWQAFGWVIIFKLLVMAMFRQFSGQLSYFSLPDLSYLFYGVTLSSMALLIPFYALETALIPRGVLILDFVFSLGGLAVTRISCRILRERKFSISRALRRSGKRVGIIGAGDAGAALVRELSRKKNLGLIPMAFFDDDPEKWSSRVHSIPVLGSPGLLVEKSVSSRLDEIIIAMPSAPPKRLAEIVKTLQCAGLKFSTVPSLDQLATGRVRVSQIRPIEIQDLLGRKAVELETGAIAGLLGGKVIVVTGAGGSIGSELCRQIARYQPRTLLLLDQSEVQLFQIEQELRRGEAAELIVPLIADILDYARMRQIFEAYQPQILFHAAAHKHVPLMECQPGEAIKNNIFGTAQLADLSTEFALDRFVLISSDKAVNPTNVMGATKRVAEMYIQSLNAQDVLSTKFMAVRFGNVLGSSGSVVPTFTQQIAAGGPVTVTHRDVTRYFMTIPEAAGLVLQSATQGAGGEIFVLDMGNPIRIVDLANQMISMSGLKPGVDVEIAFTGLRPGEKLYEELSHRSEAINSTNHPKINRFMGTPSTFEAVRRHLASLKESLNRVDANEIKLCLKQAVPEYEPYTAFPIALKG